MLRIHIIELFLIAIPEMLVFMMGIYIVSKTKINYKKYILSSILMSMFVFVIRFMPINYGVHTIIDNIICISMCIIIGIPVLSAIYSTFLMTLLLTFCEYIDLLVLVKLLHNDINKSFLDPFKKSLLHIPVLIFLILILAFIKFIQIKKLKFNFNFY